MATEGEELPTEGEELPTYSGLPAPSAYGTLADIPVDIPNEGITFKKIPYAPIEVAPISEHMPIDYGGTTFSPVPPTTVVVPSFSATEPSYSGTMLSVSGPTGPSGFSASNGDGCISPSPSVPPSVSAGP